MWNETDDLCHELYISKQTYLKICCDVLSNKPDKTDICKMLMLKCIAGHTHTQKVKFLRQFYTKQKAHVPAVQKAKL